MFIHALQAALVKQAFQLEREIITLACKHKAPKAVSYLTVCGCVEGGGGGEEGREGGGTRGGQR